MNSITPTSDKFDLKQRVCIAYLLDVVERGAILAIYGWLVVRLVAGYCEHGGVANLILLSSEGLVVVFISIRRTTLQVSRRPGDWILAFVATLAPLMVYPQVDSALIPLKVAATIMLAGIIVQVHAKLVLGRSTGCVAANRGLKFSGSYRFVRHPMYAGYLMIHIAYLLINFSAWNVGVYALCYVFQIPRLLAEERLLAEDRRYAEYQSSVRYRLIPGVF